jgi:hypothetical protein
MAKGTSAAEFLRSFWGSISNNNLFQKVEVAEAFFINLKEDFIQAIINSEVSQELINHSNPSSILGTSGTLFGFLGLVEGQKPVEEIIRIVDDVMTFRLAKRLVRGGLKMTVTLPSLEDFRKSEELKLQWEGGYSVVDAIEKGVSGLQNYIFSRNLASSRSGEGVQTQHQIRGASFSPRPWISPIIQDVKNQAKTFR